jgi:hypothetical protein
VRSVRVMIVGVLLLLGAALCAQSQPNEPANTDPVVCFDGVYRDARNALQAYQITVGTYWKQEVDCRQRAPAASELGPCWDTLLQARPLIEQAADLYERARRAHLQQDAEALTQQGNALMRRAANLVQQAGKCFDPIFARWQQNGGKYVAGDEFHVGTGPAPGNPPDTPPGWPPGRPVPPQGTPPAMPPQVPAPQPGQRPVPRQSEHACSPPPAALVQAAEAAAEAIAGNADPSALNRLNRAQHTLPPNCPLPIQCWDMMIDAQSKRRIAPDYSTRRAQQAVACYAGKSDTPRLHGGVSTTPEEQQQRSSPSASGQDLPLPGGPTIFDQPAMADTLKPISDPSGTYDVYRRPQANSRDTVPQGRRTLAFDPTRGKLTVGSTPYQYAGAQRQNVPGYGTEWVDIYNSTKDTIVVLKTHDFSIWKEDDRGNGRYVTTHSYTIYTYPPNQTGNLRNVYILCPVGILC